MANPCQRRALFTLLSKFHALKEKSFKVGYIASIICMLGIHLYG
jgi:hypothetical protein